MPFLDNDPDQDVSLSRLVALWEDARDCLATAEAAQQATRETCDRARRIEMEAQAYLHARLCDLSPECGHRQGDRYYWAEEGRVRSLRMPELPTGSIIDIPHPSRMV